MELPNSNFAIKQLSPKRPKVINLIYLVLPLAVNNEIRKEMYKTDPGDSQFNKLYVYNMNNVSILFADIKVIAFINKEFSM